MKAIELDTDSSKWLDILSSDTNGKCSKRISVNFGENLRSDCRIEITNEDIANQCPQLKQNILRKLLGSLLYDISDIRIAQFGDSNIHNPSDWIPLLREEDLKFKTSNGNIFFKFLSVLISIK